MMSKEKKVMERARHRGALGVREGGGGEAGKPASGAGLFAEPGETRNKKNPCVLASAAEDAKD